jgi:hypothetical protein
MYMENTSKDADTTAVVAEQPTVKKVPAKKSSAKKAVAKKASVKKVATKKVAAKKATAKKATAKKATAKKATAKKATAKKATAKKVAPSSKQPVSSTSAPATKTKKVKLVRDSFTMPANEYQILQDTKKASLKAGFEVKKSDLLRIGVGLLKTLSVTQLAAARAALTKLHAGRPKK